MTKLHNAPSPAPERKRKADPVSQFLEHVDQLVMIPAAAGAGGAHTVDDQPVMISESNDFGTQMEMDNQYHDLD